MTDATALEYLCVWLIKLIISLKTKWNLIKNTPGVKKGDQELKQVLLKRCEIKWAANASWFW